MLDLGFSSKSWARLAKGKPFYTSGPKFSIFKVGRREMPVLQADVKVRHASGRLGCSQLVLSEWYLIIMVRGPCQHHLNHMQEVESKPWHSGAVL